MPVCLRSHFSDSYMCKASLLMILVCMFIHSAMRLAPPFLLPHSIAPLLRAYVSEISEARAVQLLRQHFAQRASEVLVPLNRYFTSLISSSSSPNPNPSLSTSSSKAAGSLPPFLPSAFFASLKQHGSPLPFRTRAKQKEFYERWLRSPAFAVWMRERDEEARNVLGGRRA